MLSERHAGLHRIFPPYRGHPQARGCVGVVGPTGADDSVFVMLALSTSAATLARDEFARCCSAYAARMAWQQCWESLTAVCHRV